MRYQNFGHEKLNRGVDENPDYSDPWLKLAVGVIVLLLVFLLFLRTTREKRS
jgi:hypothetical protein